MGRKNKSYRKDLKTQLHDKLTEMLHAGEGTSKKDAVATDTAYDKIFSFNSYKTYNQQCKAFINWIEQKHPECTTLKAARRHVNEYLEDRTENGRNQKGEPLSAWTIQTEAKALGKLYQIRPDDPNYFHAPKRQREDIKRSRGDAKRDKHFSEKNNDELVKFAKGTGLRRNILENLRGRDLYTREQIEQLQRIYMNPEIHDTEKDMFLKISADALKNFPDQKYFILSHKDKGGRSRFSPIIGPYTKQIVERMQNTRKDEKVWQHISTAMDVHGYRGDYATAIYKLYARPIESIPYDGINKGTGKRFQKDVYTCRKDEKGKKLDKKAMVLASKALGHNRIEVVANNYIRGL